MCCIFLSTNFTKQRERHNGDVKVLYRNIIYVKTFYLLLYHFWVEYLRLRETRNRLIRLTYKSLACLALSRILGRQEIFTYMDTEIWKPIVGYEWLYEVSNLWRVKSFTSNKILKPKIINSGYQQICLCINYNKKMLSVHRVVAEAFLPNPENRPQINHKDWIRYNNNLNNLEWCTNSENMIHANSKWRNHKNYKNKIIEQYKNWVLIKKYKSVWEIEWINKSSVYLCFEWKRKTAGWYNWKII